MKKQLTQESIDLLMSLPIFYGTDEEMREHTNNLKNVEHHYPNYQSICRSKEFGEWLEKQENAEWMELAASSKADDAIAVLDAFHMASALH